MARVRKFQKKRFCYVSTIVGSVLLFYLFIGCFTFFLPLGWGVSHFNVITFPFTGGVWGKLLLFNKTTLREWVWHFFMTKVTWCGYYFWSTDNQILVQSLFFEENKIQHHGAIFQIFVQSTEFGEYRRWFVLASIVVTKSMNLIEICSRHRASPSQTDVSSIWKKIRRS